MVPIAGEAVAFSGFAPGPVGVAVVDDDDINRYGMTHLLEAVPGVRVTASLDHDGALAAEDVWAGTDVAIVDAADHRRSGDQFPGVAVVEHLRRLRPPGRLTVIVVTGHFFDDAVRRRMREAKADFFYHRADMADARALREAVLHPDRARRPVPGPADAEAQFRHGVTDTTRVNRAIGYAIEQNLEQRIAERADPRSRRWLRLRLDFNREARLTPVTGDGRRPDRRQDLPSLPQISRFLAWATKIKDTPPPRER
ncbi:response regulator transcription factor [Actinomadura fibrosa]|uniref:Response regulator transcription factor n=1 Tax=Actinomadura fibrosa TaxID=111802 RepID=A0ABW2XZU6_9ACTN|nr:response regulator transcription factor [Actinomadura fibrosa]